MQCPVSNSGFPMKAGTWPSALPHVCEKTFNGDACDEKWEARWTFLRAPVKFTGGLFYCCLLPVTSPESVLLPWWFFHTSLWRLRSQPLSHIEVTSSPKISSSQRPSPLVLACACQLAFLILCAGDLDAWVCGGWILFVILCMKVGWFETHFFFFLNLSFVEPER